MGITVTHGNDDSGLSTAKPANPNDGHKFWCTDTFELVVYDAGTTSWKAVGPAEAFQYLDGAVAGVGAASKAAVLGENGAFTFPTGAVLSAATTGAGLTIGGAAAQKIGFFGATAVGQPSTSGLTTGFTAGSGTAMNNVSTSTGGTGSTAYTFGDVVFQLKTLGLLKS
jgi:hypothetical protein